MAAEIFVHLGAHKYNFTSILRSGIESLRNIHSSSHKSPPPLITCNYSRPILCLLLIDCHSEHNPFQKCSVYESCLHEEADDTRTPCLRIGHRQGTINASLYIESPSDGVLKMGTNLGLAVLGPPQLHLGRRDTVQVASCHDKL